MRYLLRKIYGDENANPDEDPPDRGSRARHRRRRPGRIEGCARIAAGGGRVEGHAGGAAGGGRVEGRVRSGGGGGVEGRARHQ